MTPIIKKELEHDVCSDESKITPLSVLETNTEGTQEMEKRKSSTQPHPLHERRVNKEQITAAAVLTSKLFDMFSENSINGFDLPTKITPMDETAREELPEIIIKEKEKKDKKLDIVSMVSDVCEKVEHIESLLLSSPNLILPKASRLQLTYINDLVFKILTKKSKVIDKSIEELKARVPELSLWVSNKTEMKKMGVLNKIIYLSEKTGRESLKYPDVHFWLKELFEKYSITKTIKLSEIRKINPTLAKSLKNFYYKHTDITPIIQIKK